MVDESEKSRDPMFPENITKHELTALKREDNS
jgi:hypothetical protein